VNVERFQVKSSSIRTIGYDAERQLLEVTFTSDATYLYSGVSKQVADTFLRADSKGHYFQAFIRPCFPCERLHAEGCGKYLDCTVVNCLCFCHKTKKEAIDAKPPNQNLEKDLRRSIKAAKAKKRQPI